MNSFEEEDDDYTMPKHELEPSDLEVRVGNDENINQNEMS